MPTIAQVRNLWSTAKVISRRRRRFRGGRGLRLRGVGGGRGGRSGFGRRRRSGLARGQPRLEFFLGHGLDHDRHEAMVLAAQFGALTAVHAFLLDVGPALVDEARHRVLLPAQRRHPPGMDHVVGRDDEADLGIHRQHQRVVHVQQVMRVGRHVRHHAALPHLVGLAVQAAGELDVLAQVLVLPHPLITGDLHRHLGVAGVVHGNQLGRGRPRHHHQDDDRDDGPDDLGLGVVRELRRHRALGSAELEDRIAHRDEHDHADDGTHPQRHHVRFPRHARGMGDALAHVELPGFWIARLGPCHRCRQRHRRQPESLPEPHSPPVALLHCLDP